MSIGLAGSEPRSESLLEDLREAILTGRYGPGAHLVQDDLAAAFGVSRIPLREALRRLEGEGLVVISPNRGAVVRSLAPKDVVDLYDLRIALESLAVRRAAERYADLRGSTKTRHAQARAAIVTRNLSALFRLDRDFHADIAAASDNNQLVESLGWNDHEAIAAAIAHGEADRAVEKLTSHLTGSRDRILASLRAKGDRS